MSNKPDHEASMAKAELIQTAKNAMSLYKMIQDGDNLDGWVSSYITLANDYLNSVQEHMEGQTIQGVEENKKGVRAPKRTTKPKNPVAKNAFAAIGGGAAGAHKDKKKAAKQGDTKHKASAYESMLEAALQSALMEKAPKGWEGTVKAMKKHDEIDNPWALAHWMKNKGYKSHKKK